MILAAFWCMRLVARGQDSTSTSEFTKDSPELARIAFLQSRERIEESTRLAKAAVDNAAPDPPAAREKLLRHLASCCFDEGHFEDACTTLNLARAEFEKCKGERELDEFAKLAHDFLTLAGDRNTALAVTSRISDNAASIFGADSDEADLAAGELESMLIECGKIDDAIGLCEKQLEGLEKSKSQGASLRRVRWAVRLADCDYKKDSFKIAEMDYRRAWLTIASAPEPKLSDVHHCLARLTCLYSGLDRATEGLVFLDSALLSAVKSNGLKEVVPTIQKYRNTLQFLNSSDLENATISNNFDIDSIVMLGDLYVRQRHYERADKLYGRVIAALGFGTSISAEQNADLALAISRRADCDYDRSRVESAEKDYQRAVLLAVPGESVSRHCMAKLAGIYSSAGNYREGTGWFENQLESRQGSAREVAHLFDKAGWLHYMAGDALVASQYFQKSLSISQKLQDMSAASDAHFWLAKSLNCITRTDDAITHLRFSLQYALAHDSHYDAFIMLSFMGDLLRENGELNEAEFCYARALSRAAALKLNADDVLAKQAMILRELKQTESAAAAELQAKVLEPGQILTLNKKLCFETDARVDGIKIRLTLDTGADTLNLFSHPGNPELMKLLRQKPHEKIKLKIGKQEFGSVDFQTRTLSTGSPEDGVIGWAQIRNRVVEFDWEQQRAVVLDGVPPGVQSWPRWKLCKDSSIAAILADSAPGSSQLIYLDTGDYGSVAVNSDIWRKLDLENAGRPRTMDSFLQVDGVSQVHQVLWASKFELLPLAIDGVMIQPTGSLQNASRGCAAFLGMAALSRFDLVIDGPKSVVYARPRSAYGIKLSYNRIGAEFVCENWTSSTMMGRVLEASPAYNAGLRTGDQLVEYNGHDVAGRVGRFSAIEAGDYPVSFSEKAGTKYRFTVLRGSERLKFTVKSEEIFPEMANYLAGAQRK